MSGSLWPGLLSWIVLYCSDYALTIRCARMYRAGVDRKLSFEGSYELNPYFQKDVDSLRRLSPNFVYALGVTCTILVFAWQFRQLPWPFGRGYHFLLGWLILTQLALHVRHFRNLFLFSQALRPEGVQGRIEYRRFVALRVSAVDLASFAALFLALFVAAPDAFLLGGAMANASIAWKHWRQARVLAGREAATVGREEASHGV
jgi:hypothetical protein